MKKVSDHIYQINLGTVNAFVIDDKGLTLIDTGYKNDSAKIFKSISKVGKNPNDIKQIILTHCHSDHAGSAAAISRKLSIPVYSYIEEASLIENGISGRYPLYRTPGVVNWMVYHLFIKSSSKNNEPVKVEEFLVG